MGNYWVRESRFESDRVHPAGVVARELTDDVVEWLRGDGVPAVDHLDTRDLVVTTREHGAMECGIAAGPGATPADARAELAAVTPMSEYTDISGAVSVDTPQTHNPGGDGPRATLIDCGAKASIIDALTGRDAVVTRVPYDATPAAVAATAPDLLFFSNVPGDPATYTAAADLVTAYPGKLPIAGICLG